MKKNYFKKYVAAIMICLPVLSVWSQPIEIWDADDLRAIHGNYTGSFILMDDIDFAEIDDWLPIGVENSPEGENPMDFYNFLGTLDGNGKTLRNITVFNPNRPFTGALFVKLAGGAVVKNLILENVDITGSSITGGLAGTAFSNADNGGAQPVKVENVYISGIIRGAGEVGGILGRCNNEPAITIIDCSVHALISGTDFVPYTQPNNIAHVGNDYLSVGGIVGSAHNGMNVVIENCLVQGKISATSEGGRTLNLGGLIGHANANNANITLKNSVVAAVLPGGSNAFWGNNTNPNGNNVANITVNNCHVNEDLGLVVQSGGEATSLAELQTQDFYVNGLDWDFNDVWQIEEGEFPIFQWQDYETLAPPPTNAVNISKDSGLAWTLISRDNGIDITVSEPVALSLYDLTGRQVFAAQVSYQASIAAAKGIYILKLKGAGKQAVEKIVVK